MDENVQNLVSECKQIEEDSRYTAEAHYLIGKKLGKTAFGVKVVPPCAAVFTAFCALLGAPLWVSWITLLGGLITILNIFLEPDKKAKEHMAAGKGFTVLKHDARALHEAFSGFMTGKEFMYEVRRLRDRYNMLVQSTPTTDDEECWEKARENIGKGHHKADFREGMEQEAKKKLKTPDASAQGKDRA